MFAVFVSFVLSAKGANATRPADRPGKPGTLRFEPPPAPKMLKHAGIHHWGLAFEGISVGSESAPVAICNPKSKKAGQKAVCGAIPDSGTTLMMGPQAQIYALYTDTCSVATHRGQLLLPRIYITCGLAKTITKMRTDKCCRLV